MSNKAQEIVRLYHNDNTLVGRYSEGVGVVMVELYSDVRAFSVALPSLFSSPQTQFFFKNLGANTVTLTTQSAEIIDYAGVVSHAMLTKQFYSLLPNNIDRWLSLESN